MLAYPLPEARELLTNKIQSAKLKLSEVSEEQAYLRNQITTTQVNIARVFNWDVKRRYVPINSSVLCRANPADLSGTGPARIKPRASRYGRWGRLKSTVSLSVYFEMEGPMPQARVSISWPGDGLPLLLHPILCTSVMVFFKYFQSLISASPAVDTTPETRTSTDALLTTATRAISKHITNISQDQIKNLGITLSTHFVKSNPNIMFVTFFVLATVTLIAFKYLNRVLEDNKQLKADNRKLTKLEKDLERDRVLEDNKQLKADICELTKLEKDLERDRLLEDNKQLKADNRELTKLISAGSLIGQGSENDPKLT
ncbi:hypothetical protein H4Q26_000790 [Puccinia striiformis f. sp. tritici PST-130]|nr:hypothetical protein H4Q26_000790 [Puccinia striiformis f. sp. tritici PST-130]